jgi:NADH-ubiquinone oxidoreductase chain 1
MILLPLIPIFILFLIACIAETNRAPFDLAEAESELVSGFMTEHSAAIFVFFFLAEYASIVLICFLTSVLFLGGYLPIISIEVFVEIYNYLFEVQLDFEEDKNLIVTAHRLINSLALGLKTSVLIFVFILVRASYPRIRYDQLMTFC